jgi:hypothetical protein
MSAVGHNAFAELVRGWLLRAFPAWARRLSTRENGELELVVRAPAASRAGHLRVFTDRGNLWVRFDPPRMCYSLDTRREMVSIIKQLLSDRALFVVKYRADKWTGATLVRRHCEPVVGRGEVAHVVSWSGRYDRTMEARASRRARARVA